MLRKPNKPFYFNTSEHLLRIGSHRASTLSELLQGLETCAEDSIFQHTFRTLQEHHFIPQGFSNDFAHWSHSACHEPVLAEKLASVDVREFTAIEGLRKSAVVPDSAADDIPTAKVARCFGAPESVHAERCRPGEKANQGTLQSRPA
jgi:hypothetical protein